MNHIFPKPGETAGDVLRRSVGGLLLLNVTIHGEATSVCANIESNGSAAWNRKSDAKRKFLRLENPEFFLTDRTIVLRYEDVNTLANNFHIIREAMPAKAVKPDGSVAVGNLSQVGGDMDHVLVQLEQRSDDIIAIVKALIRSLDTKLFSLRRSVGQSVGLVDGDNLSDYACDLLAAFSEAQQSYAQLPELRGFGTENPGRGQGIPNRPGDLLRYFMKSNPKNPLAVSRPLDYLAYEFKPLNISDGLRWNSNSTSTTEESDPRFDSVDLLMSLGRIPVFTEVKMASDKFVSAALVQLLYYASLLANDNQKARLAREIKGIDLTTPWLCVIAQQRNNVGFASDLASAVSFLQHENTKRTLAPHLCGAAILVIEEKPEPTNVMSEVPMFHVAHDGEFFIEWRASA